MVFTNSYILTRVMLGSALPHNDVTSNYFLTTKHFNTKSFAFRFAAVLYFTFAFFMCHGCKSLFFLMFNDWHWASDIWHLLPIASCLLPIGFSRCFRFAP